MVEAICAQQMEQQLSVVGKESDPKFFLLSNYSEVLQDEFIVDKNSREVLGRLTALIKSAQADARENQKEGEPFPRAVVRNVLRRLGYDFCQATRQKVVFSGQPISQPTLIFVSSNGFPPSFDKKAITPKQLVEIDSLRIRESINRVKRNDRSIRAAYRYGDADDVLNAEAEGIVNFEEYLVQWILGREIGNPDSTLLDGALRYKKYDKAAFSKDTSPFWKTKAALLAACDQPGKKALSFLKELGFAKEIAADNFTAFSPSQKFVVLEEIYNTFTSAPRKWQDPMLKGELEFQLALAAPDKGAQNKYLQLARHSFDQVIFSQPKKYWKSKVYPTILFRLQYMKHEDPVFKRLARQEFLFYQGQARALKAETLLLGLENATNPEQRLGTLLEAYALLKDAVQFADGIYLVNVKRLAATTLMQIL